MSKESSSYNVLAPINQQQSLVQNKDRPSKASTDKSNIAFNLFSQGNLYAEQSSCRADSILKSKSGRINKKNTHQIKELDNQQRFLIKKKKMNQENSFSLSDLNLNPSKLPVERVVTQPTNTYYANKPMYAKSKQFKRISSGIGYSRASQYQKYNKLTPTGLSGKSSDKKSDDFQKRVARTQAEIELLGDISIFNPSSGMDQFFMNRNFFIAEKENNTQQEIKKIQKEQACRDNRLTMKNADKQQINLLNNPQYIRKKAPTRINSAAKYVGSQNNISQPQIYSYRNTDVAQQFQRLEKSFSNMPETQNGQIISECLRGLQEYQFDEQSPLNQSNRIITNAPKKRSVQNKKGFQRYNSSYGGRNNTTSCSRLASSSTYNTTATHSNIMANGSNIPGIKQQQL